MYICNCDLIYVDKNCILKILQSHNTSTLCRRLYALNKFLSCIALTQLLKGSSSTGCCHSSILNKDTVREIINFQTSWEPNITRDVCMYPGRGFLIGRNNSVPITMFSIINKTSYYCQWIHAYLKKQTIPCPRIELATCFMTIHFHAFLCCHCLFIR